MKGEKYPDPWPLRNWALVHSCPEYGPVQMGIWFTTEAQATEFVEDAFERTRQGYERGDNSRPERVPGGYRAGRHSFVIAPLPNVTERRYD